MTKEDKLEVWQKHGSSLLIFFYYICETENKDTSKYRGNARKCGKFEENRCMKKVSKTTGQSVVGIIKHLALKQLL